MHQRLSRTARIMFDSNDRLAALQTEHRAVSGMKSQQFRVGKLSASNHLEASTGEADWIFVAI